MFIIWCSVKFNYSWQHWFRTHEASSAPEYGPSPGGGAGSSHGSRSRSLRGWAVIKKAIFTPIGTKDVSVSTHRRRRSRRNLHDPREQHPDERINGIQSISSDQESEEAEPATNNHRRKSNQKLAPSLTDTLTEIDAALKWHKTQMWLRLRGLILL